ncbi:MAG: DUF2029 domain-containing protein [Acidobacteria bacterium]|nr:DUF2029 domain-containing protein [Acidobacteriota bacterium]MBI3657437.1 DUF2029 domain-containing protein [Acidobacteriota bacterium]
MSKAVGGTGPLRLFRLTLIVILAGAMLSYPLLFWRVRNELREGANDFVIFYTGAQVLKAGQSKLLYDYETQTAFQAKFSRPVQFRQGPLLFNHAPFELLLFLPLAYLSLPAAYYCWLVLNLGLLAAIGRLLQPLVSRALLPLYTLLLFGFFPGFIALVQGQDSILALFLITVVIVFLKSGREGLAGIVLSLGLFKPQLVLPLLVVLLFKKRWTVASGFFLGCAGLAAISVYIVGWTGLVQWLELVSTMNQRLYSIDPLAMPNIRGGIESLMVGKPAVLVVLLMVAANVCALIGLCYAWRGEYQVDTPTFYLKLSLCLIITVLTSYHLFLHDAVLLVLPAIFTCNYFFTGLALNPWTRSLFLSGLTILCFPGVYNWLLGRQRVAWLVWIILLMAGAVAVELFRHRQRSLSAYHCKATD